MTQHGSELTLKHYDTCAWTPQVSIFQLRHLNSKSRRFLCKSNSSLLNGVSWAHVAKLADLPLLSFSSLTEGLAVSKMQLPPELGCAPHMTMNRRQEDSALNVWIMRKVFARLCSSIAGVFSRLCKHRCHVAPKRTPGTPQVVEPHTSDQGDNNREPPHGR
jgi:hypothetical protein